jgi:hypothetical protein
MAKGQILSCTINPDGLSATFTIESFAAGAKKYHFDTYPPVFTVVSKGFSGTTATTVTRIVIGVKLTELVNSGSNLVITVDLDRPIYEKDNTSGSGTSPVLSVPAGWITRGIPYSDASLLLSSYTPTQSSNLAYPLPISRWASVPCRRFTGTWTEEVTAFALHADSSHPLGVSAVKFKVTDSGA